MVCRPCRVHGTDLELNRNGGNLARKFARTKPDKLYLIRNTIKCASRTNRKAVNRNLKKQCGWNRKAKVSLQ